MACEAKNCKEFIMQNKQKFGITEDNLTNECLDICTKNVKYIASRRINERIVLPSMSQFINSCTGLVDTACGIDTKFASLRITHAKEQLVDCDTATPGVQVTIKGQVIVRTKPASCSCPASYMAIPVELVSEVIYDYYSTQTGERISCLSNILPAIDGSCMVINLSSRIYREVCQGNSRYVAHIRGSVVDKLWKTENIWVEGIRPYPSQSVSVIDVFDKDICPAANSDYVRLGNRCNSCGYSGTSAAYRCSDGYGCDSDYNYGGCDCDNGCYNGCPSNYTNSRSNGCYDDCDDGCYNGCSTNYTGSRSNGCDDDCDDGCYNGCSSNYTGRRSNGCDDDCDDGCYNGCSSNYTGRRSNGCDDDCDDGCYNGCSSNYTNSRSNGCYDDCDDGCYNGCSTNYTNSRNNGCDNGCDDGCYNGCSTNYTGRRSNGCDDDCDDGCYNGCSTNYTNSRSNGCSSNYSGYTGRNSNGCGCDCE